jgi:hypothetical protein
MQEESSPLGFDIGEVGVDFSVGGLPCVCDMSFITGQFTGTDSTDWFFGSGGSLNISGALVSPLNSADVIIPSTTLLTGSFLGPITLFAGDDGFGDIRYNLEDAQFLGTVSPDLLNYW